MVFSTRTWMPTGSIPDPVAQSIKDSEVVIVMASIFGKHRDWVERELSVASTAGRQLLFVADRGVLENIPPERTVYIARSDIQGTILSAMNKVKETTLEAKAKDVVDLACAWRSAFHSVPGDDEMSEASMIKAQDLYEELEDRKAFCEAADGLNRQFMSLLHEHPALALIDSWLEDESGYDERVWPEVKEGIEQSRLSDRRRFNE